MEMVVGHLLEVTGGVQAGAGAVVPFQNIRQALSLNKVCLGDPSRLSGRTQDRWMHCHGNFLTGVREGAWSSTRMHSALL